MFISILGRQPKISIAELEMLFGAKNITQLSAETAQVDAPTPDINRLGGSIKIVENLSSFSAETWEQAETEIIKFLVSHAKNHSDAKINVGMSVYGDTSMKTKSIKHFLINTKKKFRRDGYSMRVIPNKEIQLNSAQVLHNKLNKEQNIEVVLIRTNEGYAIGRTSSVQDIEALARRDQGRPKRDAKVGMLPPKLAIIMLNLATDEDNVSSSADEQANLTSVVLDPFCGTGVVLQEALLMGLCVYGTDIDARMIEYSTSNLDWLKASSLFSGDIKLEKGDAREHTWDGEIGLVVSETYLGPAISTEPTPNHLASIKKEVNALIEAFLTNLAFQTPKGLKMCIAVPAWRVRSKFVHLDILDDLEKLGYTRQVLKHVSNQELIYFRPNQIVARELLILERN